MEKVNIEQEKIEELSVIAENTAEVAEPTAEQKKRPYEFKKLDFDNIFPMMNLIDKIGIDKVASLTDNQAIMNLIQGKKPMKLDEEGNEVVDNDAQMKLLASAFTAIGGLLVKSIKTCRNELYEVLSSASNLSVEEISKLPIKYSYLMIYDFIKKDDFKDFFTVVMDSFETE